MANADMPADGEFLDSDSEDGNIQCQRDAEFDQRIVEVLARLTIDNQKFGCRCLVNPSRPVSRCVSMSRLDLVDPATPDRKPVDIALDRKSAVEGKRVAVR